MIDLELVIKLALVAVAGVIVWLILQPRALFVIVIRDGRAEIAKGKAPRNFLEDVNHICHDRHIHSGKIRGVRMGKRVLLAFSRQIPANLRQSFRNAWGVHG
jgi:hypothetical protein